MNQWSMDCLVQVEPSFLVFVASWSNIPTKTFFRSELFCEKMLSPESGQRPRRPASLKPWVPSLKSSWTSLFSFVVDRQTSRMQNRSLRTGPRNFKIQGGEDVQVDESGWPFTLNKKFEIL